MTRTIAVSFTLSFVIVAAWASQIVCYQEQALRLDPLAPMTISMAASAARE
jgi:hypothetical protein